LCVVRVLFVVEEEKKERASEVVRPVPRRRRALGRLFCRKFSLEVVSSS